MVIFSVAEGGAPDALQFEVAEATVLLAGIPPWLCRDLVEELGGAGFTFLVGCAPGVDRCFRRGLSETPYAERALGACAFKRRLRVLSTCDNE